MTRRVNWSRVLVYGLVPTFVLLLAIAAGLLKWHDSSIRHIELARQSISRGRKGIHRCDPDFPLRHDRP